MHGQQSGYRADILVHGSTSAGMVLVDFIIIATVIMVMVAAITAYILLRAPQKKYKQSRYHHCGDFHTVVPQATSSASVAVECKSRPVRRHSGYCRTDSKSAETKNCKKINRIAAATGQQKSKNTQEEQSPSRNRKRHGRPRIQWRSAESNEQ